MTKRSIAVWTLLGATLCAAPSTHSQTSEPQAPSSTATAPSPTPPSPEPAQPPAESPYGAALPMDRGPWVLGDVLFAGNQTQSAESLQSKVRARRGSLYVPEDIFGDVASLKETGAFLSVSAALYAIADQPVPSNYASIAVSTHMVRLVFTVAEKTQPASAPSPTTTQPTSAAKPAPGLPPAPVSGVVLTPTAYRGFGRLNEPGLGLDINAVYYIGRLYGKNSLSYTTEKTSYLDRIGVWLWSLDGKLQLQSEAKIRPAMAVGAQGYFTLRDSGQPAIPSHNVTIQVSQKTNQFLANAYVVASKKFYGVRSSAGYMRGNFGNFAAGLSEHLSPQALLFNGHPNQAAQSKDVIFANLLLLPKREYPLAVEFIKPNGMALQPWLLNFKIGYFLKLNFDIAYLRYAGGWDLLGIFQFRMNYFPRR